MKLEDIEAHVLSALQLNTDAVVASDLQAARLGLQAHMAQRIAPPENIRADALTAAESPDWIKNALPSEGA